MSSPIAAKALWIVVIIMMSSCVEGINKYNLHKAQVNNNSKASGKIKHVIVLMMENRSFDHIFGWYPGVNGLKGNECNLVNGSNPSLGKVCVAKSSPLVAPCDPDHGTPATTTKVFGSVAVSKGNLTNATMSGFVEWENVRGNKRTNYCDVMASFSPSELPIMNTLAQEFAMFDRFFAAHPGPTWPNRMYCMSGTSAGSTETGTWFMNKPGQLFPQPTIFDQVAKEGLQWRHYFNDTPWEIFLQSNAHNPENVVSLEQFYADARTGNLPSYAWINPRSGFNLTLMQGSNDQHPDHDMALGEAYYKDIYEALRASPQWNETLFIITYDEHGGFYDHVPTPIVGIPSPGDTIPSYPDKNFTFERLGVRIPTLLISPLIPKGLVISEPPKAQKPYPSSEYSLTSIIATARLLLGMKSGPLTHRDAWSATFEHVLLDTPRTDCPMHLPATPPPSANYNAEAEMDMPVNGLQETIMEAHANLLGLPFPKHIKKQGEVSHWLQEHFAMHKEHTLNWKRSKESKVVNTYLTLRAGHTVWISSTWILNRASQVPYITIATRNVTAPNNATVPTYCMDYGNSPKDGSIVGVSICYPTPDPKLNRDPAQQWVWTNDMTVRPYAHQDLCLTANVGSNNDPKVYLKSCSTPTYAKYWSYHYNAQGDYDYASGGIGMSDWNLGISISDS